MAAAGGAENFVGLATTIVIDQENVNVDFVGERMTVRDGKGKSVNFVH